MQVHTRAARCGTACFTYRFVSRGSTDTVSCAALKSTNPLSFHPTWEVGTYRREGGKVGCNDPCPCGSGKKFKKCCGEPAAGCLRYRSARANSLLTTESIEVIALHDRAGYTVFPFIDDTGSSGCWLDGAIAWMRDRTLVKARECPEQIVEDLWAMPHDVFRRSTMKVRQSPACLIWNRSDVCSVTRLP